VSAGTLTENHLNEATPRKTTASGFISAIYIGLLTLILAATAWLFFQSRTQADHFASLLLMQTVSTSIGGILAVVLAGFITWNHINKVRTHRLRTEYEELQSRLKTAQAELQKANARNSITNSRSFRRTSRTRFRIASTKWRPRRNSCNNSSATANVPSA
jgi:ABC-type siderophore export system fused ATPase/permease subunit